MAMPNNMYGTTLPAWLRVEAVRFAFDNSYGLRVILQGYDADATVMFLPRVEQVFSPGRSERITLSKREILEAVLESAAKQLAELELERT